MKATSFLFVFLLVLGLAAASFASGEPPTPPSRAPFGMLYLFQEDSTGVPVPGGAWGTLEYRLWGPKFTFAFEGHGLDKGTAYTLIYYPDPYPGKGLICLGSAKALGTVGYVNMDGNVAVTSDLPLSTDKNAPYGGKIWLVLSADVDCKATNMIPASLSPANYLLEYTLIYYHYTP